MGIGNLLMGDEGLGPQFVNRYSKEFPHEIDLLDGGTGGLHLMHYFEHYKNVILIDATLDDNQAGTITLLKPRFSRDFPKTMSTHDIGMKDLVESMSILNTLPKIYLFTVSIDKVQPMKIGLSNGIEKCLPKLKDEICHLISALN